MDSATMQQSMSAIRGGLESRPSLRQVHNDHQRAVDQQAAEQMPEANADRAADPSRMSALHKVNLGLREADQARADIAAGRDAKAVVERQAAINAAVQADRDDFRRQLNEAAAAHAATA